MIQLFNTKHQTPNTKHQTPNTKSYYYLIPFVLCFLWANFSSAQWNQNATTIHTNLSVGINLPQAESYLHIFEQPPFLGGLTPIGLIRLQSTDVNMNPVPNFYWDFRMDYSPNLTFWQKTNGNASIAALELSSTSVKVFEKLKVGSNAEYAAGLTPDNTQGYFLSLGMKELSSGVWQGKGAAFFTNSLGDLQLMTNNSNNVISGSSSMLNSVRFSVNDANAHFSVPVRIGGPFSDLNVVSSAYNLYVKTGIRTEKVVVDYYNVWPDFVFDEKYELMPLSELKSFVATNNHLPNIPSAKKVEDEGVNLGEMNALLLKKVEELTLYIFQLEERLSMVESKEGR